jgi:hypothetical protein
LRIPVTAPGRLALLLPWLNGDYDQDVPSPTDRPEDVQTFTDYDQVRRDIAEFLRSFDGSAACGHIEVARDRAPIPDFIRRDMPVEAPGSNEELREVAAGLRLLLDQSFEPGPWDGKLPAGSLRFSIRSAGRQRPKGIPGVTGGRTPAGGANAVRDYRGSGAFVLQVDGRDVDLVPFLVAHLLTQPEMVSVRRCARSGCDRYLVTALAKKGRPRTFCSTGCGDMNRAEQKFQKEQKRRRRGGGKR